MLTSTKNDQQLILFQIFCQIILHTLVITTSIIDVFHNLLELLQASTLTQNGTGPIL